MKKVCLLLPNGFEAVEASVFTDVIGWNYTDGDGSTQLVTVGTKEELKCTWNFRVKPEMHINDLNVDDFDALAIPGGYEEAGFFEDAFQDKVLEVIRAFDRQSKPIATICVAAIVLGKSGVLKNRNATTYNFGGHRQKQLAEYDVNVIPDQAIVIDKNIITSYNPATAFDVAFQLLEILTSKEQTHTVKQMMGFIE